MIECPICGYKTRTVLSLKLHVYYRHGWIQYKCPICGFHSKRGNCIIHYMKRNDKPHQTLFLLVKRGHGKNSTRELAAKLFQ